MPDEEGSADLTLEASGDAEAGRLSDEIEAVLPPDMSPEAKHVVVERVIRFASAYSGPLPHPRHLREYELIQPGFAERIFARMEAEQSHRQDMERCELHIDARNSMLGLWLGFTVSLFLILGAIYCATVGASAIGVAFVSASAAGVVKAFIDRQRSKHSG